jgi:uncharacterized protein YcfL
VLLNLSYQYFFYDTSGVVIKRREKNKESKKKTTLEANQISEYDTGTIKKRML